MKYSVTVGGIFLALIPQVISIVNAHTGTDFTQGCLTETWTNLVTCGGLVVAYIGRIRHGDVNLLGGKK